MRKRLALTAFLGLLPAGARAGAGASAADILNIGVGPRATAMGGSFAALADDASALYWNPAGLARLQQKEVGLSHAQWVNGFTYEYALYAHPQERWGTWAGSFSLLKKDSIPGYDENAVPLGDVGARGSVATAGWGRAVTERLSVGLSGKWIKESLAGYSASSYALDLGALAVLHEDPFRRVSAGAALRNLGKHGAFVASSEPLPRVMVAGLGFQGFEQRLSADAEAALPRDQGARFSLGAEYWMHPMLAARAGYRSGADVGLGLSAGVGVRVRSFQFDYAFADLGALGPAHRAGVAFRFGRAAGRYYEEGLALMRRGDYAAAFLMFNKVLAIDRGNRAAMLRMKECRRRVQEELKQLEPAGPGVPEKAP